MLWTTLVAVVAIALFFDFTNGFHDTANSIATAVSTRALSPRFAVIWAATLNFAGPSSRSRSRRRSPRESSTTSYSSAKPGSRSSSPD